MSRGGRTAKDVHEEPDGRKFILCYVPNDMLKDEKVYLPR